MAKSLIVGNWKMYTTSISDAHVLSTTIRNNVAPIEKIKVILCPPFLWLTELAQIIGKSTKISLGGQNVFFEPEGAYTGEISPLMIKEVAEHVIIGHSERREHFGETNFDVNEKVLACLKAGLKPIICVGERKKTSALAQPVRELSEALKHVPSKYYKNIVVAYEPVWAISNGTTGDNANPEYVAKVAIKLRELVDKDTAILYGGSVNSKNIKGYAERPEINGVLVGGASVRASEFVKICKTWSEIKSLK
jgi:triosephosphate isomerase